ncbi:MAG: hypothetical protein LQ342_007092 [Letrouitia transgressa]|nr:MAG: hypothetical protein LQ342_007092 [Letrouitia transgressa]
MCVWFCETFCCFLLRFRDRISPGRRSQDSDAFDIEPGPSVYALPRRDPYFQHVPAQSSPILTAPAQPVQGVTRTTPRSRPLPVVYPDQQASATQPSKGKTAPNRMKPLPPLRTTFDGGGGQVVGHSSTKKPTSSGSNATFRTPAPPYASASSNPSLVSPAPSYSSAAGSSAAALVSAESSVAGGIHSERQRGRPRHRLQEEDIPEHGPGPPAG